MDDIRKYDTFQQHVDNALEKVQGSDINTIQDSINSVQIDSSILYQKAFLNECIFVLDNNPSINYMFYMDFENLDEVLKAKSQDYIHDKQERCVYNKPENLISVVHSVEWKSKYGGTINDFILKVDARIPRGGTIRYYLTTDLQNYFPIKPGESVPKKFTASFDKVYIKSELISNRIGESPRLFGLALYCNDRVILRDSVVIDPSTTTIIDPVDPNDDPNNNLPGETNLIYDSNGVLKQVLTSSGSIVDLTYENGKLDKVVSTSLIAAKTVKLIRENGVLKNVLTERKTL